MFRTLSIVWCKGKVRDYLRALSGVTSEERRVVSRGRSLRNSTRGELSRDYSYSGKSP